MKMHDDVCFMKSAMSTVLAKFLLLLPSMGLTLK